MAAYVFDCLVMVEEEGDEEERKKEEKKECKDDNGERKILHILSILVRLLVSNILMDARKVLCLGKDE